MPRTTSPTADFLARAIAFSGKSQKEIAREAGLGKPNFLSMMKLGEARVPINRIPALARACNVDAGAFLRMALVEYHPEVWEVLTRMLGEALTLNEMDVVHCYRVACEGTEVEMDAEVCASVIATVRQFRDEDDDEDDTGWR